MESSLAREAVSEIKESGLAEKITLHVMGEPTLHPDFFGILDYARQKGQPVGLTTNGAGLGGKIGRGLLDYHLHQIEMFPCRRRTPPPLPCVVPKSLVLMII